MYAGILFIKFKLIINWKIESDEFFRFFHLSYNFSFKNNSTYTITVFYYSLFGLVR